MKEEEEEEEEWVYNRPREGRRGSKTHITISSLERE